MLGPFNNTGVDDSGFYVPFYSTAFGPAPPAPFVSQFATVAVRPRGGQRPDALINALRREVNKADANLPLYFVGTPRRQIDVFVASNRIIATMFTIFGAVAVVLASVGIYGDVVLGQPAQPEFGRMALAPTTARFSAMVLKQGAAQIASADARPGPALARTVAARAFRAAWRRRAIRSPTRRGTVDRRGVLIPDAGYRRGGDARRSDDRPARRVARIAELLPDERKEARKAPSADVSLRSFWCLRSKRRDHRVSFSEDTPVAGANNLLRFTTQNSRTRR
jgi:hypothetical protein